MNLWRNLLGKKDPQKKEEAQSPFLPKQKDPIEIRKASISPVRDVYDFVELEAEDGDTLSFIKGEKDSEDPRFARIPTYAEKFGKNAENLSFFFPRPFIYCSTLENKTTTTHIIVGYFGFTCLLQPC